MNHARALLDALLAEHPELADGYRLEDVTGEGRYLPVRFQGEEIEEASGCAITADGTCHYWWLSWDAERAAPQLELWDEGTGSWLPWR